MAGRAALTIARIVAVVLVGAGIAGLASLVDARQLAFVTGVIAIVVGGVFVGASNQASWMPLVQRYADPTDEVKIGRGLLGTGYGVAAVGGLLGAGLLVGAMIDDPAVLISVGVAGLVVLTLLRAGARQGPV